ncbi:MAG: hypothetical protein HYT42_01800 [Candidatus Sungbacteria bacterium]|nr:hypothetical protein [Candidatus Sungbacteria bacterium]
MTVAHQTLAAGRWREFSLAEQLGNIGSEVSRARGWQGKDEKIFAGAVERALELLDLTIADPRWRGRLKELARARELFCDALLGGVEYKSSFRDMDRYFFSFAFAARIAR